MQRLDVSIPQRIAMEQTNVSQDLAMHKLEDANLTQSLVMITMLAPSIHATQKPERSLTKKFNVTTTMHVPLTLATQQPESASTSLSIVMITMYAQRIHATLKLENANSLTNPMLLLERTKTIVSSHTATRSVELSKLQENVQREMHVKDHSVMLWEDVSLKQLFAQKQLLEDHTLATRNQVSANLLFQTVTTTTLAPLIAS
jgi:hypothetical protein